MPTSTLGAPPPVPGPRPSLVPAPPQVRVAEPADLAAAGAVTVAAYTGFLAGPEDPYLARLADAAARAHDAELWVALEADGAVVGTLTWCPPGSPWRELAAADEGEFRMLAVAPAAWGRGVGTSLVARALERGREERRRAVVLSSLPGMAAAHRLYARLGFAPVPERDWAPVPGVDLIAFSKELA